MNIDETIGRERIEAIAEEAYIFAFPMLMGYRFAFASFLSASLTSYRGPINEIHGEALTLGPEFKDVITPNADTPYSFALLDLRAEPMILEVPRVEDRYYVIHWRICSGPTLISSARGQPDPRRADTCWSGQVSKASLPASSMTSCDSRPTSSSFSAAASCSGPTMPTPCHRSSTDLGSPALVGVRRDRT